MLNRDLVNNTIVTKTRKLKMKLKPFFVLSLLMSAGMLQTTAGARTGEEIVRDLTKATDLAVTIYREQGMAGLVSKTQECYQSNTQSPFYCVYLDLASRHIDQMFVQAMQVPPNAFFADKQFGSRLGPVFSGANMSMDTANQYLASTTPVINQLVDKKILSGSE
ncbi:MAG: hypothetical protein ACRC6F_02865 [Aeromonas sp.]